MSESFVCGIDSGQIHSNDLIVTTKDPAYTGKLHLHLQYVGSRRGVCFLPLNYRLQPRKVTGNYLFITGVSACYFAGESEADFASAADLELINYELDNRQVKRITAGEMAALAKGQKSSEQAAWYCVKKEEKHTLYSGDYEIVESGGELSFLLSNVITHAKEGSTTLKIEMELDTASASETLEYLLPLTKKKLPGRILSFFPEKGAVYPGEPVKLIWTVENVPQVELIFPNGTKKTIQTAAQDYEQVKVTGPSEYTLCIEGQSMAARIDTLPLYLEKFFVDYTAEELVWKASCAKAGKITLDGTPLAEEGRKSFGSIRGNLARLEAEGTGGRLESLLYVNPEKSGEVEHFQKTITYESTYQILHVSWKTKGLKHAAFIYQDVERGELREIQTGWTEEKQAGEWEQLLWGDNVKITLRAQGFASCYSVTI